MTQQLLLVVSLDPRQLLSIFLLCGRLRVSDAYTYDYTIGAPENHWRTFWNSSIPPNGFTIWWRLIHQKISCRQRLYDRRVKDVDSSNCIICNNPEDYWHLF
ncbi:hypothetical protein PHYBLDRAFT_138431 [Phycomyces blakesleeanus NRRL 1555(-)]|uniref:Reverse transcriptase zinc-binding domain-containing protein n=1 Tax=Phycomyces blakesleeanus (strain ATCC 8743b / DSM 1359 / FGSC 10004 / NBRC 33097 / NRRL 1555) TaxID=763407 RepID=A0A167R5A3_PHYB8|nr:hypothetical protein PHYBLDRAFT_138431 [Phycomyces blakesleeanus NRRL 1555(-)]OAD80878.1 hypothetical protein PHYBLDRAFT_138431 [Phycomyces blakesleeanus NRRL 1555(-)]|eukprot:XP_018298918.1 hypothetical protein PHYBLDRAFT_138431 [Phycomyces blakesleeanus NRRL 1555(-)]